MPKREPENVYVTPHVIWVCFGAMGDLAFTVDEAVPKLFKCNHREEPPKKGWPKK